MTLLSWNIHDIFKVIWDFTQNEYSVEAHNQIKLPIFSLDLSMIEIWSLKDLFPCIYVPDVAPDKYALAVQLLKT